MTRFYAGYSSKETSTDKWFKLLSEKDFLSDKKDDKSKRRIKEIQKLFQTGKY